VGDVLVQAVRVRVPGDVEPVPAPALAVRRRREQPVHDPGERVGRRVGQEGFDLCRVGGRPVRSNVARRMSVRLSAVGAGRRPRLLQPGQDESVDRRLWPDLVRGSPAPAGYSAGRRPSVLLR